MKRTTMLVALVLGLVIAAAVLWRTGASPDTRPRTLTMGQSIELSTSIPRALSVVLEEQRDDGSWGSLCYAVLGPMGGKLSISERPAPGRTARLRLGLDADVYGSFGGEPMKLVQEGSLRGLTGANSSHGVIELHHASDTAEVALPQSPARILVTLDDDNRLRAVVEPWPDAGR
jgi:hypothetical protein